MLSGGNFHGQAGAMAADRAGDRAHQPRHDERAPH
jgi:hypothetical protein